MWRTARAGIHHSHRPDENLMKHFRQNLEHDDVANDEQEIGGTEAPCGASAAMMMASLGKHAGTAQHSEEGRRKSL